MNNPGARILAAVMLMVLLPLFGAIALGILVANPGPVFYLAERAGLGGRVFRMYKFRTMRVSHEGGSRISSAADARVFGFGAILRRLRLDELPQLLNIVRGEMAFVGPRPEDPWFVEHAYSAEQRETLNVLPGLTSPGTLDDLMHAEQFPGSEGREAAYISGPMKRKLELDCVYARNVSLAGDLRLVLQTVRVLARIGFRAELPARDRECSSKW